MGSNPVGRAIVFNDLDLSLRSRIFFRGTLWGTIAISDGTWDLSP